MTVVQVEGLITELSSAVRDGNTVYYFKLREKPTRKTHSMQPDEATKAIPGVFEANIAVSPRLAFATTGYVVQLCAEKDDGSGDEDKVRKVITYKFLYDDRELQDGGW